MRTIRNPFEKHMEAIPEKLRPLLMDSRQRRAFMFQWLNALLALLSCGMTAVNALTREYVLMALTLAYSVACTINFLLCRKNSEPKGWLVFGFALESIALLATFTITGIPDGFSVLWICLIPSFALLVFGFWRGSLFCLCALVMTLFLFWVPSGRALLRYEYSQTFMLRFPMLYLSIYVISLFIECVRSQTQKLLVQSEDRFRYLYRHDALTGLFNRYGFDSSLDELGLKTKGRATLLMIDIDDFKQVNDSYSHLAGDEVLKTLAESLKVALCSESLYCRWGGEEFLALLRCGHDHVAMAERLRQEAETREVVFGENRIRVTVSVGVYMVDDMSKTTLEAAIREVDKCLYEAKSQGKNRVIVRKMNA